MIDEEERKRKNTYERIRKRLRENKYRSAFFRTGAIILAGLLIFSLFPLVPVIIVVALGLSAYNWSIVFWFLCIGIFGVLFWIFQRFARRIEARRGITLEERMYVPAYEALCHLREYTNRDHPILGSKPKAVKLLQNILVLIGEVGFPNVSLIREEENQIIQLYKNLRTRLIPSIKRRINGDDSSTIEAAHFSLIALTDYLSEPKLNNLVTLNQTIASLPETTERNIFVDFRSMMFRRTNLRHASMLLIAASAASLGAYIDFNVAGGSLHDAFTFGVITFIALSTLYVTYLGLTKRAR